MQDMIPTQELIPISLIKAIISDSNKFVDFVKKDKEFANVDQKYYVNAINEYVQYEINNGNLTKDELKRIKYLNSKFKIKKKYKLNKEKNEITVDDVLKILNSEELFNKFYNYEENKEFFNNIPIENYLNTMYDLFDYFDSNKTTVIDSVCQRRFNILMQKYSLKIKRNHLMNGVITYERLNEKLENLMFKGINSNDSKFTIARKLYLNSCKFLNYDLDYLFYDSSDISKEGVDVNEKINALRYKNIREITFDDNEVICSTWSKIYASLLNKVGIKNRVRGDYHKFVIFDCDGTLMSADATQSVKDMYTGIYINDFTRVQLGIKTQGYKCLEKNKDVSVNIKNIDKEYGYPNMSLEDLRSNFLNTYSTVEEQNPNKIRIFKDNMTKLLALVKNLNLSGLEKLKALENYAKLLFPIKELENINYKFCVKNELEKRVPYLIFTYKLDDEYLYFLISENDIKKVTKEELEEKLNTNYYLLNAYVTAIPGFEEARKI